MKLWRDHFEPGWLAEVVVWNLILHRILLSIGAGITLGLAGGMMQWALKNPLAPAPTHSEFHHDQHSGGGRWHGNDTKAGKMPVTWTGDGVAV